MKMVKIKWSQNKTMKSSEWVILSLFNLFNRDHEKFNIWVMFYDHERVTYELWNVFTDMRYLTKHTFYKEVHYQYIIIQWKWTI